MVYRLQNEFELARNQSDSEAANYLHENYMMAATQFFSLRNTLIEPKNGENLLKFYECSAFWLTQVTVKSEEDMTKMAEANCFAPKESKTVTLPVPDYVPHYLRWVVFDYFEPLIMNPKQIHSRIPVHQHSNLFRTQTSLWRWRYPFTSWSSEWNLPLDSHLHGKYQKNQESSFKSPAGGSFPLPSTRSSSQLLPNPCIRQSPRPLPNCAKFVACLRCHWNDWTIRGVWT